MWNEEAVPTAYQGPIIDAHHHLWDLRLGKHPWLMPSAGARGSLGDLAGIRRNYLPEDYLADSKGQNIVASLHVEAGWLPGEGLDETRWLLSLDRPGGVARGLVAAVALADPKAPDLLAAQAALPGVVGVRDILAWSPGQAFAARDGLMDDPAWRQGLRALPRLGLSFDLMVFPRQLAAATRLAADFPEVQFVLNHGGSPVERDAEGMALWRRGLRDLARNPNVAIKISDLVAYDPGWSLDSLRPVVSHCIDCFGPDRAMFGSDLPVASLYARPADLWSTFRALTADLAEAEQRALFHDTAARIYRLHALPPPRLAARQQEERQDQRPEQDHPPAG
jgi:predicted TIM-barrel fold metal-dependent hydrolase